MATEAKLTADAPPMSSSAPRPHRPARPPSRVRVPSRRPGGGPASRGTRASCYPRSATPAVASPARTPPPRYLLGHPAYPRTAGRGAPLYRTSRCPCRRAGIA
ncbi:hypothetical protein GQ55_9G515200 [Panicum hallii var. hallii]|uniref:Uncharacterized protein n=1 Tax=Panicum hallii var. hallii TaxID=1504633 RepID=A0A2T7CDZ4_9POAL|nr:hypothetical protein GQ55_9G515200 [Panicum hallii var. hallii]